MIDLCTPTTPSLKGRECITSHHMLVFATAQRLLVLMKRGDLLPFRGSVLKSPCVSEGTTQWTALSWVSQVGVPLWDGPAGGTTRVVWAPSDKTAWLPLWCWWSLTPASLYQLTSAAGEMFEISRCRTVGLPACRHFFTSASGMAENCGDGGGAGGNLIKTL